MSTLDWLLATPIIVLVVAFTIARIKGRQSTSACCAPADPSRDLRMREAFTEPHADK